MRRAPLAKLILALGLFAGFAPAESFGWEMNQLSILMPLPAPGAPNLLWPAKALRRDGLPLPERIYRELPQLTLPGDRNALFENLRVVAVRLDPCFREGGPACQKQVRFVWQPVESSGGTWRALDAAIHTFHLLSDGEWKALTSELADLNRKFPIPADLPLGIHPLLKAQGMDGPYGRELARILKNHARESNLIRATAMNVNGAGTIWVFTGFDIENGELRRIPIAKTDNVGQALFSDVKGSPEFRIRLSPEPAGETPFLKLLSDSSRSTQILSESEIVEAVRRALVFNNPRLSNSGTVDCASCHAARSLPAWGRTHFSQWNWNSLFANEIFRGPGNLSETSVNPARTNILRAFGYWDGDPIVSPRVIHETSATMEAMNGGL